MPIFALLFLFLLLILSGTWYAYAKCFYSPSSRRITPDEPLKGEQYDRVSEHIFRITHIMEKVPFEEVRIISYDGLELYGRYYHLSDDAPVEILFHGYRSHAYRDCSGGHALTRKMGFNALVVDQRAHGNSGGNTITFGIRERQDVCSWVSYCCARFGNHTPIVLSGLSMGAATVLMASNLPLPENVACIIADSPYSSPSAIIEKVCKDLHYPLFLCRPFLYLAARIYGGFRLNESTAKSSLSQTGIPILLIHGEADHFVPCSMTLELAQCCNAPVTVHTFPDAGHGLCYMTDPLRYEYVVTEFLCRFPVLKNSMNETFTKQVFEK